MFHSHFIGFDGQIVVGNLSPDYFCRHYAMKDLQNTLSELIVQYVGWALHGVLSFIPGGKNKQIWNLRSLADPKCSALLK